jgi:adenylosuccinate lyase
MSASTRDALSAVDALSPVDGRYRAATEPLRGLLSEAGLIRERIRVEAQWLLHLSASVPQLAGASLSSDVIARARQLAHEPSPEAAAAVKAIEARTNHDVKAVEYYVREQLSAAGAAEAVLELVHFGCTSEDINNLSYARILQGARARLLETFAARVEELAALAHRYADTAMLARTHGQPASPTTLGKEFANVTARLRRARQRWQDVEILGKWNGAVGNFNAHVAALPGADWPTLSRGFIESLGLVANPYTTQIEPHDWIAEYCDALAAANVILIDLCRDCWGYISLGYLRQRAIPTEVGSSTMPHKVNPIDFENAEGNLGIANALLRHFSDKLPVSRWQRDLTDSTVLRNMGVSIGYSVLAYDSLTRGLDKLELNEARLAEDLDAAWEVLAEPIQTVMRRHGLPDPYDQLKKFTRGQPMTRELIQGFVAALDLPEDDKARLLAMTPGSYTGIGAQLAAKIKL